MDGEFDQHEGENGYFEECCDEAGVEKTIWECEEDVAWGDVESREDKDDEDHESMNLEENCADDREENESMGAEKHGKNLKCGGEEVDGGEEIGGLTEGA